METFIKEGEPNADKFATAVDDSTPMPTAPAPAAVVENDSILRHRHPIESTTTSQPPPQSNGSESIIAAADNNDPITIAAKIDSKWNLNGYSNIELVTIFFLSLLTTLLFHLNYSHLVYHVSFF